MAEPTTSASEADQPKPVANVVRQLRKRIQSGELQPGEWLREVKLAAEFNTGRSAIRTALKVLQEDGLVELEPFRGGRVTTPTPYQLFDLFEVRAALFGLTARFTCFRASQAEINEIVKEIDTLSHLGPDVGVQARVDAGVAAGAMMTKHASPEARAMMIAADRRARWHYSYLGLAEGNSLGPLTEWAQLRAALLARDADLAADAARKIVYFTQGEVTKLMVARGAGAAQVG